MSVTNSNPPKLKKRRYRRITPDVVTRFLAQSAIEGNGTAAVRVLEPDAKQPEDRAVAIAAKAGQLVGLAYIDNRLTELGVDAIDRVGELVHSADEKVAGQNARFIVDHVRGKAVQRTENKNYNLSIEAVLE